GGDEPDRPHAVREPGQRLPHRPHLGLPGDAARRPRPAPVRDRLATGAWPLWPPVGRRPENQAVIPGRLAAAVTRPLRGLALVARPRLAATSRRRSRRGGSSASAAPAGTGASRPRARPPRRQGPAR